MVFWTTWLQHCKVVGAATLHLDRLRVVEALLTTEVAVLHNAFVAADHVDPNSAFGDQLFVDDVTDPVLLRP